MRMWSDAHWRTEIRRRVERWKVLPPTVMTRRMEEMVMTKMSFHGDGGGVTKNLHGDGEGDGAFMWRRRGC